MLPMISDKEQEHLKILEIKNIFDLQNDMYKQIKQRQKQKRPADLVIEVEHKFIDFQVLVIGEKMRNPDQEFNLDDSVLAELMI